MRTQYLSGVATLIAVASFAGAGQAAPISDTTSVISYNGGSATNFFPGPSSVGDTIGPFDTKEVEVTISGLTIEFKFLTQHNGTTSGAHYADLFIASDPGNPDSFDYGLALGFQSGFGGLTAGLHSIASGADYDTSIERWAGTGYTYGGQYISAGNHDAPTVLTGGALLAGWTVTAAQRASGDGSFPYYLDIVMTADSNSTYYDVFGNGGFSAFWGTGDCSNDGVYLTDLRVPPREQSTPEPATLALFSSGLLGFGAIRRRLAKR